MSPRKKIRSAPTVAASAAEWVDARIGSLSAAVTNAIFSRHPELESKYGKAGREKCHQDTVYHLHYLAEAISSNSEAMFNDYAGWAKIMLFARGIASDDLLWNLRVIGEVLKSKAPPKLRRTFARFIDS